MASIDELRKVLARDERMAEAYQRGYMFGYIRGFEEERERCAKIADAHASCEGIAQLIAAEIRNQA